MSDNKMTESVLIQIKESISEIFDQKMDKFLKKVAEGQFYKELALEMKAGLDGVYNTISEFKETLGHLHDSTQKANNAFQEASDQLDAIVRSTEQATDQIMDLTEKNQKRMQKIRAILEDIEDNEKAARIMQLLDEADADSMGIVAACSFQDITGQRIKKVVSAMKSIEDKLLTLLVSAGVKMKGREEGKDSASVNEDTRKAIDLLKGPQEGVSQDSVDSLLEDLGL